MELLNIILNNLLSPAILFFLLGIIAGVIKSDLSVPTSISKYLTIYLMMSIGFKGGYSLLSDNEINLQMLSLVATGIMLSFSIPFISFWLLNLLTKLDKPTAAAVAAHYGSVSIVTFATAVSFIKFYNIEHKSYIISILAIMEAPAILSGLYIAHKKDPKTKNHKNEEKILYREIFTNGAILLLLGSFIIGFITGKTGYEKVEAFLITPFNGILCLFLLDMGLIVAKEFHHFKKLNFSLFLFGIYMPITNALIGMMLCYIIGVDKGTTLLFTVLCSSASYIAVPAAMRLALPEAKAGIYIPMSLAITFPFNIIFGIPMYYTIISLIFE